MRRTLISSAGFHAPRPSTTADSMPPSSVSPSRRNRRKVAEPAMPPSPQHILEEPRQRLSGHFSANAALRAQRTEMHGEESCSSTSHGEVAVSSVVYPAARPKRCRSASPPSASSFPSRHGVDDPRTDLTVSATHQRGGSSLQRPPLDAVTTPPPTLSPRRTLPAAQVPRNVFYPPPAELAVAPPMPDPMVLLQYGDLGAPVGWGGGSLKAMESTVAPTDDCTLELPPLFSVGGASESTAEVLRTSPAEEEFPSRLTTATPSSSATTLSAPSHQSPSFFISAIAYQHAHQGLCSIDGTPSGNSPPPHDGAEYFATDSKGGDQERTATATPAAAAVEEEEEVAATPDSADPHTHVPLLRLTARRGRRGYVLLPCLLWCLCTVSRGEGGKGSRRGTAAALHPADVMWTDTPFFF